MIAGPTSAFVAAEVTFDVTANVVSGGAVVTPGLQNTGVDGFSDNADVDFTPVFAGAIVNGAAAVPTLSVWSLILFPVVLLTAMGTALWRHRSARMSA